MSFALFAALALLFALGVLVQPWWSRRRRDALRARAFPANWRRILRRNVPYLRRLPADLQLQLKRHMLVFLAEKPFLGCAGMVVTEEVRVTIAAQACLLLLNRPDAYFPDLRQILVYPGPFVVERAQADAAGLQTQDRRVLTGESWSQGQVILSWQDVLDHAWQPDQGHNVVLHEFAHQLDQETGAANGAPELRSADAYARWSQVLGQAYAQLQAGGATAQASALDDYGATNPAEFFAVATEAFFLRPLALAREQPALYEEFRRFYAVHPLAW